MKEVLNSEKFFDYLINNNMSLIQALNSSLDKDVSKDSASSITELKELFKNLSGNIEDHIIRVLKNYAEHSPVFEPKMAWSIVFHDSGKLYTHIVDENGINHYIGHQQQSAELFDKYYSLLNISEKDSLYIHSLVRWHDDMIGLKKVRELYNACGKEFFEDFIKFKQLDIADHNDRLRERGIQELNEYIPRLNKFLTLIEKENLKRGLKMSLTPEQIQEIKKSKIQDVSLCKKTRDEDKGVTEKLWLDVKGKEALFKITQFREDGTHTNAHYAELFVSKLCKSIGIPSSDIELAHDNENIGCLSYNFLKPGDEMTDFNEILSQIRPDFDSKKLVANNTNEAYSIPLVLEGLEAVSDTPEEFQKLKQQFLCYCLIYSQIEHYDVNPSNISVIKNENGINMAPMFDNGTSLDVSIPPAVVNENLSQDWLLEIRTKNLSKIGTDKRYCQYDDLENYIFAKYYKEIKPFLDELWKTKENTTKILSSPAFAGMDDNYKKMITMMIAGNLEKTKQRAEHYLPKYTIEHAFENFSDNDLKTGLNGLIPEIQQMIGLPQRNQHHIKSVDSYCVDVINSINRLNIPDEKKKLMQWAALFNEIGKTQTHEVVEKNGKPNDIFRGHIEAATEIAEKYMKKMGFLEEDAAVITSLIKSHVYRDTSRGCFKGILSTVKEKNIDLYFALKECENINKNPENRDSYNEQQQFFKDGINEEIKHNNRELISVLPMTGKKMQVMGLKGPQIGKMQNMLAEYIRENPNIYAYYKARGHVDKYKKDLSAFVQQHLKEVKRSEKGNSALKAVNDYIENAKHPDVISKETNR